MTADPDNDLFWRFRSAATECRRSPRFDSGGQRFAESQSSTVRVSIRSCPPEVLAGQSRPGSGWGNSAEEQQNRRSVYIHVKRSLLTPMLTAFDFPDPDLTCEARFMTLQPGQALSLLNSDFIHEQASAVGRVDRGGRDRRRDELSRRASPRGACRAMRREDEIERRDEVDRETASSDTGSAEAQAVRAVLFDRDELERVFVLD